MKKYTIILILVGTLSILGCKDYLDAKPDKKLAVPHKISDLWALLDNYSIMNRASPVAGEDYTDNYYLTETSLNAITNINTRNNYTWDDKGERIGDWSNPYRAIFYANVVLDELDNVTKNDPAKQEDLKAIQGSALFFRSFLFYEVAQIFAPQYSDDNLLLPCIPLRLNSDPNDLSVRSTVQETYNRIVNDLKFASILLPETSSPKNRPTKAAAFGLLGRVYLNMGDYQNAALYADSCLSIYRTLIDYNSLNKTTAVPIARFNDEVIFASRSYTESGLMAPSRCKIDTMLYNSYAENDLRKVILFKKNTDGSYTVKGSYDGSYAGAFFNGIATDEQYLILAECYARMGFLEKASSNLNTLLSKRTASTGFVPKHFRSIEEALDGILKERRKEMIVRGLRWSDIRRLSREPNYTPILKRKLGNKVFELLANDKRYITLIPTKIIQSSNMTQNDR